MSESEYDRWAELPGESDQDYWRRRARDQAFEARLARLMILGSIAGMIGVGFVIGWLIRAALG